jgi:DNA-binding XRE family transcriptional regulator
MNNRCKVAREQAGLSVGQAAKLLGLTKAVITACEDPEAIVHWIISDAMAYYYGCSVEWLCGDGPDMDYETVKAMKGSEKLPSHDRVILAKFAASLRKK